MTALNDLLLQIKERAEKATEGLWTKGYLEENYKTINSMGDFEVTGHACGPKVIDDKYEQIIADAEFIAHSRSDIPRLLAVVEKLREQRDNSYSKVGRLSEMQQEDDAELAAILEGK